MSGRGSDSGAQAGDDGVAEGLRARDFLASEDLLLPAAKRAARSAATRLILALRRRCALRWRVLREFRLSPLPMVVAPCGSVERQCWRAWAGTIAVQRVSTARVGCCGVGWG